MKASIIGTSLFVALFFLPYSPATAQTKPDSVQTTASDSLFTIPRKDLLKIAAQLKLYQVQLKTEYDNTQGKIDLIQQMIADTTDKKANK